MIVSKGHHLQNLSIIEFNIILKLAKLVVQWLPKVQMTKNLKKKQIPINNHM